MSVNTTVEHVGKDAQGNMDVPKDANNVAWYELGYKPGENGNAVIAGHLDTKTGPAIFYNLNQLKVGDEITVATNLNKKLVFTVVNKQIYKANNFPVLTVFGTASEPLLNLITCTGVFDRTTEHYLDRVVVITKLKNIL
jgi:LPXTG-site transpeptidase (sortase) family protein